MRVVFVGEAPSRPVAKAFTGDTPNGAGKRLAKLLGMTPDEMHERYTLVNLFPWPVAKWDPDAAGLRAWEVCVKIRRRQRDDKLIFVYLGRRVAVAMNFDRPFFTSASYDDGRSIHVVVPHPSGRSRAWNDKRNVARFRKVMSEIGVL